MIYENGQSYILKHWKSVQAILSFTLIDHLSLIQLLNLGVSAKLLKQESMIETSNRVHKGSKKFHCLK
jgi:hypothetical protein